MGVHHTRPRLTLKPPSIPKLTLKPPSIPKLTLKPLSIPKLTLKPLSIPKLTLKPLRQLLPENFRGTRGNRTSQGRALEKSQRKKKAIGRRQPPLSKSRTLQITVNCNGREINNYWKKEKTMALKKFRDVIGDRQSPVSRRLEKHAFAEETYDTDIRDAASVYIGDGLPQAERRSLSESFISKIEEMCESTSSFMAMAIAVE
jgi:hypothetical protein